MNGTLRSASLAARSRLVSRPTLISNIARSITDLGEDIADLVVLFRQSKTPDVLRHCGRTHFLLEEIAE